MGDQLDLLGSSQPTMRKCTSCTTPTVRLSNGVPLCLPCEPKPTYATAPATSYAAGKAAKRGPRSRVAVEELELLAAAGSAGLTDDELQALMPGDPAGSISKRRVELVRAGYVVATGATRPTRWGRQAQVWRLARRPPVAGDPGAVTEVEHHTSPVGAGNHKGSPGAPLTPLHGR